MNALEQSFANICAKHGVHYIDVSLSLLQDESARFCIFLQWTGEKACSMGHGATIEAALAASVADMHAKRGVSDAAFADEPLIEDLAA